MAVSQGVGLVFAICLALVGGEAAPGPSGVAWAIAGGLGGSIGIIAFYRALAGGAMGLVAPLAGLIGIALPVVVGAASGDQVNAVQTVGMGVALVAVVCVSVPASDQGAGRGGLLLAVVAGIGFGSFFVGMNRSADAGAPVLWTVVLARSASLALALAVLAATGRLRELRRGLSLLMPAAGIADLLGNVWFLLADHEGTLGIASVVSSQYPVITVLLARVFLAERLARVHAVGVALAVVGIALIAAQ